MIFILKYDNITLKHLELIGVAESTFKEESIIFRLGSTILIFTLNLRDLGCWHLGRITKTFKGFTLDSEILGPAIFMVLWGLFQISNVRSWWLKFSAVFVLPALNNKCHSDLKVSHWTWNLWPWFFIMFYSETSLKIEHFYNS